MATINFEKRIFQQGGSHLISLPKCWVLSNNLQRGDKLLIDVYRDGNLLIKKKNDD